jgi:transcriptional regulator with XRE-family HTH domain
MCARRMLSAYDLGKRLGVDPKELLDMINGKQMPTAKIVRGLARELGIDEGYLEKLAEQVMRLASFLGPAVAVNFGPPVEVSWTA